VGALSMTGGFSSRLYWVMAVAAVLAVTAALGPASGPVPARGQSLQLPQAPARLCDVAPRTEGERPEPSSEMRLVRDANGGYWQIQSGCRHRVEPFVMDSAAFQSIAEGEPISFVTSVRSELPPSPMPLNYPPYAGIPAWLVPESPPASQPSASVVPPPSVLEGYADRVLAVDQADPQTLYLLDSGLRHRVILYFPLNAIAAGLQAGEIRPSDVYAVLLRRPDGGRDCSMFFPNLPPRTSCANYYTQILQPPLPVELAGYVATIEEVPEGEPAPYYGWGRGESQIVALGNGSPTLATVQCPDLSRCSVRFNQARRVTMGQFQKDPQRYAGQDIVLLNTWIGDPRYQRRQGGVSFRLSSFQDQSVSAFAPGIAANVDGSFVGLEDICAGVAVPAVSSDATAESTGFAGVLPVFEYVHVTSSGARTCRASSPAR